jgi:hypothetical protein
LQRRRLGNDTSGGTTDTSGSTSGTTDEDTSGSTSGTTDTSGGSSGTTDTAITEEDSSGTSSGTDTSGGDTSGSTCTDACCPNTSFTGQVFEDVVPDPTSTNGGNATTTPYAATYDAGISAVIAAAPAAQGAVVVDLDITEATVTAVGFKPGAATGYQSFWLADGQEAIQVFLGTAPDAAPAAIRVGQKVSFTATGVDLYRDLPQITNLDATTWTVDSEDNDVFIDDVGAGEEITIDDVQHVIRVTGTLTGESVACGGTSKCTQLDFGGTSTVTLRVSDSFKVDNRALAAGDCVTFAGPAGVFDGVPQLDVTQFDWLWNNN